VTGFIL